MKMNEMYPSKYLAKEDVPQPRLVVIASVTREDVKTEHGNEPRTICYFQGNVKPMILNKGNATAICEAFGDDSTLWHGKTIEVYTDPSVMFAGKRVGGLRVRVPSSSHAFPSQPAVQPAAGHNGTTAEQLWDLSDGKVALAKLNRAQVQHFLNQHKIAAHLVRLKPHGEPATAARTADEWGFEDGYTATGDIIPF